ncbi:hypothetical protein NL329_29930, partial [Klebsiella pneumoniae]|nr:hypothetical protein [Klebsiella pneumoniae]
KSKTPITFRPDQITGIVPEATPLDEYVARRTKPRDTAQAEFDLGVWCEEQKLADLATAHFEAAVRKDPEFVPAQEKLGRTLVNGKWLDADG